MEYCIINYMHECIHVYTKKLKKGLFVGCTRKCMMVVPCLVGFDDGYWVVMSA